MAEHGEVQYATAEGNDLPAHEAGFSQFRRATETPFNLILEARK